MIDEFDDAIPKEFRKSIPNETEIPEGIGKEIPLPKLEDNTDSKIKKVKESVKPK